MDSATSQIGEPAALSVQERDRRYAIIRAQLSERGVDALIATGTHLLYLSDGLPGEMFGILPTDPGEAFTAILTWRYLADISPQILLDAQQWVGDIRSGRDASPVAERLKQLGLQDRTIGFAGPLSQRAYKQITSALPSVKLVDVSDILVDVRTIKSAEELALIERANRIFDVAVQRVHEFARPGMLGRQVVQEGKRAMWDAGGDLEATFKFNFGPVAAQNPVLSELCLNRRIQEGDIGTLTAHSHFHHYAGHTDQEIAFGKPNPRHVAMFDAVLKVREEVLKHIKAGATHRDLVDAYESAAKQTGFKTSPHSQMHLYGIDVPEFPGPAFKTDDPKGGKGLGGSGNFILKAGMVYSVSPTLIDDKTGDSVLGGTSFVVTDNGYRNFCDRPVALLVTH